MQFTSKTKLPRTKCMKIKLTRCLLLSKVFLFTLTVASEKKCRIEISREKKNRDIQLSESTLIFWLNGDLPSLPSYLLFIRAVGCSIVLIQFMGNKQRESFIYPLYTKNGKT